MRPTIVALLALGATAALPGAARAQAEFTFHVPVEVERIMPGLSVYNVQCFLEDAGSSVVGMGQDPIPLDGDGNFSGVVTVEANTSDNSDPGAVTRYVCNLLFQGMIPSATSPDEKRRAKEGTEFVPLVAGDIP